MKKILIVSLFAAASFCMEAADPFFRVDFNSGKDQIVLIPEKNDSMNAEPMGWVKDPEARKYTLTTWAKQKVPATEWKDYSISFLASSSGSVNVTIGAQWAKKPEDRRWLLVNELKLNNKLYKNGDFREVRKSKDGRMIPVGFWLAKDARYLPNAGDKASPAILVNHDNRLYMTLKVEAGKRYKLTFEVKAPSGAEIRK